MAEATATPNAPQCCPVCRDGFTEPKLLPCAHLVCKKCLLTMMEMEGERVSCPLCRKPVIEGVTGDTETDDENADDGDEEIGDTDSTHNVTALADAAALVESMPTDFATEAKVESEKALSESHQCSFCQLIEGTIYCLQCAAKFCEYCAHNHNKFPASRDHVTKELGDLSAEQLIQNRPINCGHDGGPARRAEVYCSHHNALICAWCAVNVHPHCSLFQELSQVAEQKRFDLKWDAYHLQNVESFVAEQMREMTKLDGQLSAKQETFQTMKLQVQEIFDDLVSAVESKRQKLVEEIEQKEENFWNEREDCIKALESFKTVLRAHSVIVDYLVSSAPDYSLLATMGKLKTRLTGLLNQPIPENPESYTDELILSLDFEVAEKIKEAIARNGQLKDLSEAQEVLEAKSKECLVCGTRRNLQGADFVAVIPRGGRARRRRGSYDELTEAIIVPLGSQYPQHNYRGDYEEEEEEEEGGGEEEEDTFALVRRPFSVFDQE